MNKSELIEKMADAADISKAAAGAALDAFTDESPKRSRAARRSR
jgi:DNA-binding protein HU-beta